MDRLSFTPTFQGTSYGIGDRIGLIWEQTREPLMVPLLKLMVVVCLTMSVMLFVERVYMGIVIALVKLFGRKPEQRYNWEPMKDDVELGNSAYPMVLVQIPMYNEKEVPNNIIMIIRSWNFLSYHVLSHIWFSAFVSAGLPALHWSCMWPFMAFWKNHNSSSGRFHRPNH